VPLDRNLKTAPAFIQGDSPEDIPADVMHMAALELSNLSVSFGSTAAVEAQILNDRFGEITA